MQIKPNQILAVPNKVNSTKEVIDLGTKLRNWYRENYQWSIAVNSEDVLYDSVHRWFTDTTSVSDKPPRALSAVHRVMGKQWRTDVAYLINEEKDRYVDIDGHNVRVSMRDPKDEDSPSTEAKISKALKPKTITFYTRNRAGQLAVSGFLQTLVHNVIPKPCLRMLDSWGDWRRRDDLPVRTLDSVVLKEGQMERIRGDLENFLASEDDYVSRGMPWHRGYLLYGPPGTGKTSIVRAIAASLNLDLWYVSLGDLDKDNKLINLVSQVSPRSVLLLEDVDVFHAAREREDESGKASLAALLNALDGVATPHGMITFLTTNDKSVLDEALIRPGRVDLSEEIGLPDFTQISKLYSNFYNEELPADVRVVLGVGKPTSYYTEVFQRNMYTPKDALEELTLS